MSLLPALMQPSKFRGNDGREIMINKFLLV